MSEKQPLEATKCMPQISIWSTATEMAGTQHERKTYFIRLVDNGIAVDFSLQKHADGTLIAVPYVPADYDYTEYDSDYYEEEEEYAD